MLGLRAKLAAKKLRHKYGRLGNPKEDIPATTTDHPELHSPDACRVVQTAVKQALAAEVRAVLWYAYASQNAVQLLGVTLKMYHSTHLSGVISEITWSGHQATHSFLAQEVEVELLQALEHAQLTVRTQHQLLRLTDYKALVTML